MIYRSRFLSFTETFIADHIEYLTRWTPVPAYALRVNDGLRFPGRQVHSIYGQRGSRLRRALLHRFGRSPELLAALRSRGVKIVHAHFMQDGAAIERFAAASGLPLVVTAHGYDATIYPEHQVKTADGAFMLRHQRRFARTAAAVVCVSEFIRGELISRGYPPEKLVVNRLGIDTAAYEAGPPASQRRGVLFAGRLNAKKGIEWLLHAWARLPPPLQREPLTIIGAGQEEGRLRQLATELGINPEFRGAQTRGEIKQAMLAHRVFAFPSIRGPDGDAEGMGVVAMEAQALGTPVLAFDEGAPLEVLSDGRSGLLARARDADDYAAKLAALLTGDALADRLGAGGPAWIAANFDLRHSMARLEAIYDRVASGLPPA